LVLKQSAGSHPGQLTIDELEQVIAWIKVVPQRNDGVHSMKFLPTYGKPHNFFFPPADTKMWIRVLPYAILGVLTSSC
jgi:hypothetical protein